MPEKLKKYLLITLVVAIWGAAIQRFFFSEDELAVNASPVSGLLDQEDAPIMKRDSFAISHDYRDPFLSRKYQRSVEEPVPEPQPTSGSSRMNEPPPKPEEPLKPINKDWSFLAYNGTVKQSGDTSIVGILRIRNRGFSVIAGKSYQGVTVHKVFADSCQIEHEGQLFTVTKR